MIDTERSSETTGRKTSAPPNPRLKVFPVNYTRKPRNIIVQSQMCGADGADPEVCLDGCSGYEAFIEEDEFAYRYYSVRSSSSDQVDRV